MRELVKRLKNKIVLVKNVAARKFLDKYIDVGIAIEDVINVTGDESGFDKYLEEEEYENEIDLEPVHLFMSNYIGMMIMSIKGYQDDVVIKDPKNIQFKIITECDVENGSIILKLSDVAGGKSCGKLSISPTKNGYFAEREPNDIPLYSSMYRIYFYGGDALEYLDTEKTGSIEYIGE